MLAAGIDDYTVMETVGHLTRAMLQRYTHPPTRKRSALETFDRVLVKAARVEHTVNTRADQELSVPSELKKILKDFLPAEARDRHDSPAFALCATAGSLRMTRERRLVDGRRLELPTSALRTQGEKGRNVVKDKGFAHHVLGVCSAQDLAENRGIVQGAAPRTSTKLGTRN